MKAAVVTQLGKPPIYTTFAYPKPAGQNEVLIDMVAAGLHPLVRSRANGSHYTSTDQLPLIPGVDGVGRDNNGSLRYVATPNTTLGSMCSSVVAKSSHTVVLPADADPYAVAAGMNPAMSSWLALKQRAQLRPGQSVVILGATGTSGQLAVQIAKHFGAEQIIAIGRYASILRQLPALGATDVISLSDPNYDTLIAQTAARADVVLDYLWGEPAANTIRALVQGRADDTQTLTWVEIGSMAGLTAPVPSAALRATALQIIGSGHGSVSLDAIVAELPAIAAALSDGTLTITPTVLPLSDVASAWALAATSKQRIVLTP